MPKAPNAEQLPDGRHQTTMDGITYRWRMEGGLAYDEAPPLQEPAEQQELFG